MQRPPAVPASLLRHRPAPGARHLAALGLYGVASFLLLGLPLLETSGSRYAGHGTDPELFIWALAWWPHAVLHGESPFVNHAIWAPGGANLMWTSSVPAIAALVAPITLLAGPVAAFNVAIVLMPVAAAFCAYLLCRYLTGSFWGSLVGGYLFGFSSYELAHDQGGHLHLTSVALLPLAALVVMQFLDGKLDRRGVVIRLGPLLAVQILLSTEISTTLALALATGLGLGALLDRARRPRIAAILPSLAASYAIALVLTSPFLYYALSGFRGSPPYDPDIFYSDLVSFLVPATTSNFLLGSIYPVSSHIAGVEAYLGLPTLAIVVLLVRSRGRTAGGRFLFASLLAAVIFALGPFLTVDGTRIAVLPWALFERLPGLEDVLTARFAVYVSLAAAVSVAVWTASCRIAALRLLLPALAILAIVPTFRASAWASPYRLPAFVTSSAYRGCLGADANILTLPIVQSHDDLWQAEANFRFRLAGGWLGEWFIPPTLLATPGLATASPGQRLGAHAAAVLRSFARKRHVTAIVVDPAYAATFAGALDPLAKPQRVGGVVFYNLAPDRACPG